MTSDPYSSNQFDFERLSSPRENSPTFARKKRLEPKHSGVGIASFVISLVSIFMSFALIATGLIMTASLPEDEELAEVHIAVLTLSLIFFMLLAMVALVLGIVGLCQKNRKKVYALLGTIFSSLMLVGILGLIALGPATE